MHAFSSLRDRLIWLERAWAAAPDWPQELTEADKAGYAKLYATIEMVHASENSARRRLKVQHCIYGPKGKCPDSLPYRCKPCTEAYDAALKAASKQEAAA